MVLEFEQAGLPCDVTTCLICSWGALGLLNALLLIVHLLGMLCTVLYIILCGTYKSNSMTW
jgi:hypothetical protein